MTKTEALESVFKQRGKEESHRYYRHLFNKGILSDKLASNILVEWGFIRSKEEIWKRESPTNKKDKPKK